ncbi:hypothetical protein JCGZ_19365 [Jatropha curcas]|uniref:Uncharacterized protein n=1 Tax=Jatropha curcas TaxID=180498 RepID=A0A067K9G9_JATCU|nr:hypothetical protein JCGZ_19365 [Jatropha curcas]
MLKMLQGAQIYCLFMRLASQLAKIGSTAVAIIAVDLREKNCISPVLQPPPKSRTERGVSSSMIGGWDRRRLSRGTAAASSRMKTEGEGS